MASQEFVMNVWLKVQPEGLQTIFCIRSLERSSKGVINHLIDSGFHFGMVKGLGKMIL